MKKLTLILSAALFVAATNSYAAFAQQIADGNWTDSTIWNWRDVPADQIPSDGYPNTAESTLITHVAQGGKVLVDTDITVPQIFVSNLTIFNGAKFTVAGRSGAYLAFNSNGAINVIDGSMYIPSRVDINTTGSSLSFGGTYEESFYAAQANSLIFEGTSWSGIRQSSMNFAFDEGNLDSAKTTDNAIIQLDGTTLGYLAPSAINLDFSNVKVDELTVGTYYVSLISYPSYMGGNIKLENLTPLVNATLADGVAYEGLELDSTGLYAKLNITSVPEPSTYAAIFGALALAFVAYRKKRA